MSAALNDVASLQEENISFGASSRGRMSMIPSGGNTGNPNASMFHAMPPPTSSGNGVAIQLGRNANSEGIVRHSGESYQSEHYNFPPSNRLRFSPAMRLPCSSSSSSSSPGQHHQRQEQFLNAPPPLLPLRRPSKHKNQYTHCVFCQNNGEDESYYMTHTCKDDDGFVLCPILRAYVCPICSATGSVAHTIKYCPQNKGDKYHEDKASITTLKRMNSSLGKPRIQPRIVVGGPRAEMASAPMQPNTRMQYDPTVGSGNYRLSGPIHPSLLQDQQYRGYARLPNTSPASSFASTEYLGLNGRRAWGEATGPTSMMHESGSMSPQNSGPFIGSRSSLESNTRTPSPPQESFTPPDTPWTPGTDFFSGSGIKNSSECHPDNIASVYRWPTRNQGFSASAAAGFNNFKATGITNGMVTPPAEDNAGKINNAAAATGPLDSGARFFGNDFRNVMP